MCSEVRGGREEERGVGNRLRVRARPPRSSRTSTSSGGGGGGGCRRQNSTRADGRTAAAEGPDDLLEVPDEGCLVFSGHLALIVSSGPGLQRDHYRGVVVRTTLIINRRRRTFNDAHETGERKRPHALPSPPAFPHVQKLTVAGDGRILAANAIEAVLEGGPPPFVIADGHHDHHWRWRPRRISRAPEGRVCIRARIHVYRPLFHRGLIERRQQFLV
ncbi:MAG: hypothetical protein M1826_004639 [Phylliscum demangeonii]|nr:MAG: hypothetical protein M1826_004639 [Phylliscum demangeonii]